MVHQPDAGATLPFRAELQPLLHRIGAKIRRIARLATRYLAHLPLQSVDTRRLRSTVNGCDFGLIFNAESGRFQCDGAVQAVGQFAERFRLDLPHALAG